MKNAKLNRLCAALLAAGIVLPAAALAHGRQKLNLPPVFMGAVTTVEYDGNTDDLLTAGLGKTGLAGDEPPFSDPLKPTAAELRRLAIYTNYRAVLDINANSGYGTLYGPNVDAGGQATSGEGKVAGVEYGAFADDGSGRLNVSMLVQLPAIFDPAKPCIVTGPASGSRGIYGAVGTSGEWGLRNGCAVVYTDKGTGVGLYSFDDDMVNLRDGSRATRAAAGKDAIFSPALDEAERAAYGAKFPGRVAFKHAHSQQNPEKDWGRNMLQGIEFAFYVLNQKFGAAAPGGKGTLVKFTPKNTVVIASSISNGGGVALLAAEQDAAGLIDGIVVSEPQVQPRTPARYAVLQGGRPVPAYGKPLLDYSTFGALYQPCVAGAVLRCSALAAKGLLSGFDFFTQQADAYRRLRAYGWVADTDVLQPLHLEANVLVATTFANAYGRFAPTEHVCGLSFAPIGAGGLPSSFNAAEKAGSFGTMGGIPGSVVYEDSRLGPASYYLGVSPSTFLADVSLDAFLCLRGLATGTDPRTGQALTGEQAARSERVRAGMAQVRARGNLRGKPAIIVHGRSDALIPVNHSARAYVGLNAAVEGKRSRLRYVEVKNANHFDAFASVYPGLIVPLHHYLFGALDAMYAHLRSGKPLPPSQVVRTTTRLSSLTPITVANVPPMSASPAARDAITVSGATVNIPD